MQGCAGTGDGGGKTMSTTVELYAASGKESGVEPGDDAGKR